MTFELHDRVIFEGQRAVVFGKTYNQSCPRTYDIQTADGTVHHNVAEELLREERAA